MSLRVLFIGFVVLGFNYTYAQLGFCTGNSGNPIFTETFGNGTNYGPELPAGVTTYNFVSFSGPQDGEYTVGPSTFSYGWNLPSDHTGDTNGKALIVNADFTPGEFYRRTVSGLCQNTTYEFSAWLINILPVSRCGGNGIPVNVRFEIWDSSDTILLASGATGNISGANMPAWQQHGLVFQSQAGQTSVILKIINNGIGGCGNDLAIDDIVFKSCGDSIIVENPNNATTESVCSSLTPYSTTLTAIPDNSVFSSHFYQWQQSSSGIIWNDIPGETNAQLAITNITTSIFYRAKVAEFQSNLSNNDCITFSDVFALTITDPPEQPELDCWETATFIDSTCSWTISGTQPESPSDLECWQITQFNNSTCQWDILGTQAEEPTDLECWQTTQFNSTTCQWDILGTQPESPTDLECWETTSFNNSTCKWDIIGTQPEEPSDLECWQTTSFNNTTCQWDILGDQPITERTIAVFLCETEYTQLQPNTLISNPTSFIWSTNQTTPTITINSAGTYTVEITNNCVTEIVTFDVIGIQIADNFIVQSDYKNIDITIGNPEDYSFSLDGEVYQNSPYFLNKPSGRYTIYVKSNRCDSVISQSFIHFYIPRFFTPNGDGVNDYFSINALQFFDQSSVHIYNRYGQLLFATQNTNVNWDGTFNNKELPTSDYWYVITIEGTVFKGNFSLKR